MPIEIFRLNVTKEVAKSVIDSLDTLYNFKRQHADSLGTIKKDFFVTYEESSQCLVFETDNLLIDITYLKKIMSP